MRSHSEAKNSAHVTFSGHLSNSWALEWLLYWCCNLASETVLKKNAVNQSCWRLKWTYPLEMLYWLQ